MPEAKKAKTEERVTVQFESETGQDVYHVFWPRNRNIIVIQLQAFE